MRNSLSFGFVLVAAGMLAQPAFAANTFHYRTEIPATQNTCDQEAQLLASRFIAETGLSESSARCLSVVNRTIGDTKYQVYSLLVTYLAEQQVAPYSVVFGDVFFSQTPGPANGIYDKYQTCLNDLKTQTSIFETETGLKAVSASCQAGTSGIGLDFTLQIDGFGTPKRQLLGYRPGPSIEQASDEKIEGFILALGARIVAHYGRTVYYYGDDSMKLRDFSLGSLDTAEHCAAELEAARSILLKTGSTLGNAFCFPDVVGSKVSLAVLGNGSSLIYGDSGLRSDAPGSYNSYDSFDECLSDSARILNDSSSAGRPAAGVVCHLNDLSTAVQTPFVAELFFGI